MTGNCNPSVLLPPVPGPGWGVKEQQRVRQVIQQEYNPEVGRPGHRITVTHFQEVFKNFIGIGLRVAPDIPEKGQNIHVERSFHRKLTKEEVQGCNG